MTKSKSIKISVFIPVYNEEKNIPILVKKLVPVLEKLRMGYEIILVNDGSKDDSLKELIKASKTSAHIKVVDLKRNYGQTAAMMAGIDHASGEILIPMDADLQNDPADIPRLLKKLDEGYEVVSGWRKDRQDSKIKRNFVSRVANKIISRVSGVHLHDYGCTLKAYRRDVIKDVRLYGEMHRFIPIYASWAGAKVTEIPVQHHPRIHGVSKYGLERLFKVVLDLIVVKFMDRYLQKPIYVFGGFGLFFLALSMVSALLMFYLKIFQGVSLILTPLPLFSAMTFLTGVTSLLMGLLAELLVRTYFESQQKSTYLVRDVIQKK